MGVFLRTEERIEEGDKNLASCQSSRKVGVNLFSFSNPSVEQGESSFSTKLSEN